MLKQLAGRAARGLSFLLSLKSCFSLNAGIVKPAIFERVTGMVAEGV